MVQSVNRDRGTKVELRRDPCAAAGRCSRKDERKAEKVGQFWRAPEITLRETPRYYARKFTPYMKGMRAGPGPGARNLRSMYYTTLSIIKIVLRKSDK